MDYSLISVRLVIAFTLVLIFFQFSGGKRQFSQMTTFDLISNFILSAILSGYLFNPDANWEGFVIILTVYFVISYLINLIANRTSWGRGLIIGTPTVIINDGQINPKNLKKVSMNMIDFMSLLRTKEVHSLKDVNLAQIEVGGELTVVRKGEENYAVSLIQEGVINKNSLVQLKKTEKWLRSELAKKHIKDIKNVFYAQWYKNELYVVKYK